MSEEFIEDLAESLSPSQWRAYLQNHFFKNAKKPQSGGKSGYEPTNKKLWQAAKSAAKRKFKVYPSAYANLWAAKYYKSKGGKWKKRKKAESYLPIQKHASQKLEAVESAGFKLGKALKSQIKHALEKYKCEALQEKFPELIEQAIELCTEHTPLATALLKGIAKGADIPFETAFVTWYEELWFLDEKDKSKLKDTGCTDLIIHDGEQVLMGHTNDESPGGEAKLCRIEIDSLPTLHMVFSRGGPSVATNSHGLVFSGNQVDANDTRSGIPRLMLYVEACWAPTIEEAEAILLHPQRASSFNNILADAQGNVITLEASAEDCKKVQHFQELAAHTNHFIWLPHKEGREGDSLHNSEKRLHRAIEEASKNKKFSIEDMKTILRTHGEGGLCRHPESTIETGFSIIFLPKQGTFLLGLGLPCKADYVPYKFAEPSPPLSIKADLRKWLKEEWVDVSRKDKSGKHPPCGRSDSSKGGYPKCRPKSQAKSMSAKEKASATKQKRTEKNPKSGKGNKPTRDSHTKRD